ncbi:MAG: hypothetical protein Q9169_007951, partial [Polycauliona sp. 2 TL-2023]
LKIAKGPLDKRPEKVHKPHDAPPPQHQYSLAWGHTRSSLCDRLTWAMKFLFAHLALLFFANFVYTTPLGPFRFGPIPESSIANVPGNPSLSLLQDTHYRYHVPDTTITLVLVLFRRSPIERSALFRTIFKGQQDLRRQLADTKEGNRWLDIDDDPYQLDDRRSGKCMIGMSSIHPGAHDGLRLTYKGVLDVMQGLWDVMYLGRHEYNAIYEIRNGSVVVGHEFCANFKDESSSPELRSTYHDFIESKIEHGDSGVMEQKSPSEGMAGTSQDVDEAQFTYRPLHKGRREIRLVQLSSELQTASSGDRVPLLRMHHASFDKEAQDLPEYIALSYTWGTGTKSIVLVEDEGRPALEVLVSKNLLDALCHFASLSNQDMDVLKRIFWIDQLCINQSDDDEKSEQVRMMTDIFGGAKMTSVWLGSGEKKVNYEVITKYKEDIIFIRAATKHDPELEFDDSSACKRIDRILSELHENDWEQLHALTSFCTHPWLERAWVVQEVATSTKIIVHWEGGNCEWLQVISLWILLSWLSRRIMVAKDDYPSSAVRLIIQARNTLQLTVTQTLYSPRTRTLMNIMEGMLIAGRAKATQPEDLIYSMMGIASDGDTCGIQVDYGKHYTEVYRDTAMYLLKIIGALALSWSCQTETNKDADACHLPSWVPGFRLRLGFKITETSNAHRPPELPKLFSATGNRTFEYTVDEMRDTLLIRTFFFDKVAETKYLGDNGDTARLSLSTRLTEFHKFLDAAADRHPSRYGISTWEELRWRLPIADRYFDGSVSKRAGSEVQNWYMEFMQSGNSSSASPAQKVSKYINQVFSLNLVVFLTDTGYIGVGAPGIVVGDEVQLIQGSDTPFILRKTDGRYELVSEGYVHGIMDGELVDDDTKFEWLELH